MFSILNWVKNDPNRTDGEHDKVYIMIHVYSISFQFSSLFLCIIFSTSLKLRT